MEYAIILIVVLLISPFVIHFASLQSNKMKLKLRFIFLFLLSLQVLSGFLNWESFTGQGRSGFELTLIYPSSYLWIFFTFSLLQFILLMIKKSSLDITCVVLNFINTVVFFAVMILLSNLLGKQIVSLTSIGVIFIVLIGNVIGLMLINKDKNLLNKYPFSKN